jgi:hypothetical protein
MTDPSGWLVSIHPYPCPPTTPDLDPSAAAHLASLLELWRAHVGPVKYEPSGDWEDFVEQAVRLEAAVSAFGLARIWLTLDGHSSRHLSSMELQPITELAELPKWGAQSTVPALRHVLIDPDPASHYFRLATFTRHAGRELHLVSSKTLIPAAVDMVARGSRRLFAKVTETKYGVYDIPITDPTPLGVARALSNSELGWAMVHLEDRPDAFLLQQHVPMCYEYRLFVVGHHLVTGAGCVERHTPLENTGVFDNKVEQVRGSGHTVRDPGTVDKLVAFAAAVVTELRDEAPQMRDYTLDVAIGSDGQPLVIELNSLLNSGLYASDTALVTAALRDDHARFSPREQLVL